MKAWRVILSMLLPWLDVAVHYEREFSWSCKSHEQIAISTISLARLFKGLAERQNLRVSGSEVGFDPLMLLLVSAKSAGLRQGLANWSYYVETAKRL